MDQPKNPIGSIDDEKKQAVGVLKTVISKTMGKNVPEDERDYRTAMQAQKELNRIFDINITDKEESEEIPDDLETVRRTLQPLFPDTNEVTELARLARSEVEASR